MIADPEGEAAEDPHDRGCLDRAHRVAAIAVERQSEQRRREQQKLLERVLQIAQIDAKAPGFIAGERVEGGRLQAFVSDRLYPHRATEEKGATPQLERVDQPAGKRLQNANGRGTPT